MVSFLQRAAQAIRSRVRSIFRPKKKERVVTRPSTQLPPGAGPAKIFVPRPSRVPISRRLPTKKIIIPSITRTIRGGLQILAKEVERRIKRKSKRRRVPSRLKPLLEPKPVVVIKPIPIKPKPSVVQPPTVVRKAPPIPVIMRRLPIVVREKPKRKPTVIERVKRVAIATIPGAPLAIVGKKILQKIKETRQVTPELLLPKIKKPVSKLFVPLRRETVVPAGVPPLDLTAFQREVKAPEGIPPPITFGPEVPTVEIPRLKEARITREIKKKTERGQEAKIENTSTVIALFNQRAKSYLDRKSFDKDIIFEKSIMKDREKLLPILQKQYSNAQPERLLLDVTKDPELQYPLAVNRNAIERELKDPIIYNPNLIIDKLTKRGTELQEEFKFLEQRGKELGFLATSIVGQNKFIEEHNKKVLALNEEVQQADIDFKQLSLSASPTQISSYNERVDRLQAQISDVQGEQNSVKDIESSREKDLIFLVDYSKQVDDYSKRGEQYNNDVETFEDPRYAVWRAIGEAQTFKTREKERKGKQELIKAQINTVEQQLKQFGNRNTREATTYVASQKTKVKDSILKKMKFRSEIIGNFNLIALTKERSRLQERFDMLEDPRIVKAQEKVERDFEILSTKQEQEGTIKKTLLSPVRYIQSVNILRKRVKADLKVKVSEPTERFLDPKIRSVPFKPVRIAGDVALGAVLDTIENPDITGVYILAGGGLGAGFKLASGAILKKLGTTAARRTAIKGIGVIGGTALVAVAGTSAVIDISQADNKARRAGKITKDFAAFGLGAFLGARAVTPQILKTSKITVSYEPTTTVVKATRGVKGPELPSGFLARQKVDYVMSYTQTLKPKLGKSKIWNIKIRYKPDGKIVYTQTSGKEKLVTTQLPGQKNAIFQRFIGSSKKAQYPVKPLKLAAMQNLGELREITAFEQPKPTLIAKGKTAQLKQQLFVQRSKDIAIPFGKKQILKGRIVTQQAVIEKTVQPPASVRIGDRFVGIEREVKGVLQDIPGKVKKPTIAKGLGKPRGEFIKIKIAPKFRGQPLIRTAEGRFAVLPKSRVDTIKSFEPLVISKTGIFGAPIEQVKIPPVQQTLITKTQIIGEFTLTPVQKTSLLTQLATVIRTLGSQINNLKRRIVLHGRARKFVATDTAKDAWVTEQARLKGALSQLQNTIRTQKSTQSKVSKAPLTKKPIGAITKLTRAQMQQVKQLGVIPESRFISTVAQLKAQQLTGAIPIVQPPTLAIGVVQPTIAAAGLGLTTELAREAQLRKRRISQLRALDLAQVRLLTPTTISATALRSITSQIPTTLQIPTTTTALTPITTTLLTPTPVITPTQITGVPSITPILVPSLTPIFPGLLGIISRGKTRRSGSARGIEGWNIENAIKDLAGEFFARQKLKQAGITPAPNFVDKITGFSSTSGKQKDILSLI